ncbi:Gfo/Idh/MocA family oxidoreductase [Paenibacillus aurantius]|uniref:Gfo/Idh/MocA family oxidoreductase n=1 Tax=Paenibacillus aurantius TaxID=2918900 RepID=A0AA96LJ95_9BACL|nr:Gfo/Idh/MocA family oxidoreductase [Paenibacillus aurantius]
MKVAIVGCGGLGHVHGGSYGRIAGMQVVGVHDLVEERARSLADKTGAAVYDSFDAMLEESGCELVSVTVPSYLHKEFTIRAAAKGKHVICEKPIALKVQDAEDMIRACREHNVRLFIGHVVRFFPDYVHMKRNVENGALGTIGTAHAKRAGGHPADARPWYADESKSGGVVCDLMIHDLDFLRWTLGEVRSVYGLSRKAEGIEYASATLVFESGAVANVEAHWGYPGAFFTAAEIAGSTGVVRSDSTQAKSLQIRRLEADSPAGVVEVPQSPGFVTPYTRELEHFVDCIKSASEPLVTAQDAVLALELALAVRESVRTGKAVSLQETRQERQEGWTCSS